MSFWRCSTVCGAGFLCGDQASVDPSVPSIDSTDGGRRIFYWAPDRQLQAPCCRRRRSAANTGSTKLTADWWGLIQTCLKWQGSVFDHSIHVYAKPVPQWRVHGIVVLTFGDRPCKVTRSSAIAEGPRDASCQLKSCQLPRNSAETTCATSPEQIEVVKLEG